MSIAVKGSEDQVLELRNLLKDNEIVDLKINQLSSYDVVFDLDFDDNPEFLPHYIEAAGATIFVGAVKVQIEEFLAELGTSPKSNMIGINSLPTFINRPLIECCSISEESADVGLSKLKELGIEGRIVESRVGLVTPRIVCMIINEAYFTVQEGTATREDIDLGMKLGTAYPHGPFEWSSLIGIQHIYETLEALYEDTKDERYKICSLLKKEYLNSFR